MIKTVCGLAIVAVVGTWALGCAKSSEESRDASDKKACTRSESLSGRRSAAPACEGTIAETTNGSGYTYVRITAPGSEEKWFAMPQTKVAVGDKIAMADAMLMTNFHSAALNRSFDKIYFSSGRCADAGGASDSAGAVCPIPAGNKSSPHGPRSPHAGTMAGAPPAQAASGPMFTGKVIDTMQAARYTYVQVESGTNQVWAAAPQFEVKKGDTVTVPFEMPMKNFTSPTLKRTFDVLYMASKIQVVEKAEPAK